MTQPAVQFNPFDRSWWGDPYPLYRRLLDEAPTGPVLDVEIRYFCRYADCDAILRSSGWGVDSRRSTLVQRLVAGMPDAGNDPFLRRRSFLFLDPPDHTRLRGLVVRAFTPRVVQRLRVGIAELVDRMLPPSGSAGPGSALRFDAVTDLAYPLPVAVICDLLGVPGKDRERFGEWSHHLAAALDPELFVAPEVIALRRQVLEEFDAYFTDLIAERRRRPADDLVSSLAEVTESSDVMTDDELLSTLVLLLVAGHETTVNLIGNAVVALAGHPEQFETLRADPALVPRAVEEVLRWDPPVQLTTRVASEDSTVGGVDVAAGDIAMLLIAAGNRDQAHVVDPDRFDVTRSDIRHLSFGLGAHHCVGAALARAEAQIALTELVTRYDRLTLAGEPQYRDTLVLRGIQSLPVEVRPAA